MLDLCRYRTLFIIAESSIEEQSLRVILLPGESLVVSGDVIGCQKKGLSAIGI